MSRNPIPVECPSCHMALRLRPEYIGQKVCCRYCGQVFTAGSATVEGQGAVAPGANSDPDPEPDSAWVVGVSLEPTVVGVELGSTEHLATHDDAPIVDELRRLRLDRVAEREAHLRSIEALRQAWDGERQGWRDQVDAARAQAERERAALQALTELLRDELDSARRERGASSEPGTVAVPTRAGASSEREVQNLRAERDRLRQEFDALARSRDVLRKALDEARASESRAGRERVAATEELAALRAERNQLQAELNSRPKPPPPPIPRHRSLVLQSDLRRWTIVLDQPPPANEAVVAVPVGPPLAPPSLEDLEAVEHHIATLRKLLRIAAPPGKPYHLLFDVARFQTIQARLREASLLAERLVGQFERSKNQKDLLWHLMVAQRNDELNRKKR